MKLNTTVIKIMMKQGTPGKKKISLTNRNTQIGSKGQPRRTARGKRSRGWRGLGGPRRAKMAKNGEEKEGGCGLPQDGRGRWKPALSAALTRCPGRAALEFATKFLRRVSLMLEAQPRQEQAVAALAWCWAPCIPGTLSSTLPTGSGATAAFTISLLCNESLCPERPWARRGSVPHSQQWQKLSDSASLSLLSLPTSLTNTVSLPLRTYRKSF